MTDKNDIFRGVGVEIKLTADDDFLKIRETLTRIGIPSKVDKTLLQSVHVLHKKGRYVIVHFKELFLLDGKPSSLSENDIARRNAIAKLLNDWGLLELVDPKEFSPDELAPIYQIKIIPYKEKDEWNLVSKYNVGTKK